MERNRMKNEMEESAKYWFMSSETRNNKNKKCQFCGESGSWFVSECTEVHPFIRNKSMNELVSKIDPNFIKLVLISFQEITKEEFEIYGHDG